MGVVLFPIRYLLDKVTLFERIDCKTRELAAVLDLLVPSPGLNVFQTKLARIARRVVRLAQKSQLAVAALHRTRATRWPSQRTTFLSSAGEAEILARQLYELSDEAGDNPAGLALGWLGGQLMAISDKLATAIDEMDMARGK